MLFGYDVLARDAVEEQELKVSALRRLLCLKALAINEPKYDNDVRLIAAKIQALQYVKEPDYPVGLFAPDGQHSSEFRVPSSEFLVPRAALAWPIGHRISG